MTNLPECRLSRLDHCMSPSSPRHRKCSFASNAHISEKMATEESNKNSNKNMYTKRSQKTGGGGAEPSSAKMILRREEHLPKAPLSSHLSFCKISRLTTPKLLLLSQTFTKGNYHHHFQSQQQHLRKLLFDQISFRKKISSLSTIQSLVLCLVFLVISLQLPVPSHAVGLYEQAQCETHGWNAFPVWKYRAGPRWVPPMRQDRRMQKEFLELFTGKGGKGGDSSEEDSYEDDLILDENLMRRIADMCPRDAFFYSLNPRHLEAITQVARLITAQHSPPEVLRVAKALKRSHYINPKVWYFGLVAGAQEREDMTGFTIPQPIDAMPDLFIPGPMLFEVMDKYRSALQHRSGELSNSTTADGHRIKRAVKISTTSVNLKRRKITVQRNGKNFAENFAKTQLGPKPPQPAKKKPTMKVAKTSPNPKRGTMSSVMAKRPVYKASVKNTTTHDDEVDDKVDKLRSMLFSSIVSPNVKMVSGKANSISGRSKLRSKTKTKVQRLKADIAGIPGNITEYQADGSSTIQRARIDAFDDCIVVDGSVGLHNGIENKLWYFREDMMVNQHHWNWHNEYPLNSTRHRPRRAELFFYMHRNLLARYNAERLSNGFPLVETMDLRPGAPIKSGYDSLLADINSGKFWTPRPPGVPMQDVIHMMDPDFEKNIFIKQYNDLYFRLKRSIQVGHLLAGPVKTLNIKHTKGIEPLANTVEASQLSVNPAFYDTFGFHNTGHQLIGLIADPKFERGVPTGVMADTITTMRDPAFFTYHSIIDNLFDLNKKSLPPYELKGGQYPLKWEGVEILNVEVISKNGGTSPNQLRTFWSTRRFELGAGVDRSIHKGDLEVDVCAVHLNHEPFDFKITVALDPCAKTKSNKGSVRLFLAPRYDEHGNRFPLKIQRRLMIHMDTFPVDLRVGRNIIYRRSYDSNAVTPWSKSIKQIKYGPKHPNAADFCGCGWPTHLYIPKGSPEGLQFDLFVMLTNYDHDHVEENPNNPATPPVPEPCNSPYLYCGVKWRAYPDAKPMGFPFDRLPYSVPMRCPQIGAGPLWSLLLCKFLSIFTFRPVQNLEEYVSYAPNMAATIVEIKHLDHLVW